jgi:site-specific DNA recombinase
MSESEMNNKEARFKRTKKANALQGKFNGGTFVKYGYFINEQGYYEINEKEAELIRLIYNMYLKSQSYAGITRELQQMGYDISLGKVLNILKSKEYTGEKENKKNPEIIRKYPPIISAELFNERVKQGEKNCIDSSKAKHIYYCSKLITCPVCGSKWIGSHINVNYYCSHNKQNVELTKRKKCTCSTTIDLNWLDSIVWYSVQQYDAKYIQEQAQQDLSLFHIEIKTLEQKIQATDKVLQKVNEKRERIVDSYIEANINKDKRDKQLKENDSEAKKIEQDRLNWQNEVGRLTDRIVDINHSLNNENEWRKIYDYIVLTNNNKSIRDDEVIYGMVHKHVKEIKVSKDIFDDKPAKRIEIIFNNNKEETYYFCFQSKERFRKVGYYGTNNNTLWADLLFFDKRFEYRENKNKNKNKNKNSKYVPQERILSELDEAVSLP